jgi:YD repeat-containing protein
MNIRNTLLLLATLPTPFALHAEPANMLDAKGHLVLQVNADNSKITNAYDQNGNLVKKETSIDKRFDFDSKGNSSNNNGGQKP